MCCRHDLLAEDDVHNMQEVFLDDSAQRREALAQFMVTYMDCFEETEDVADEEARSQVQVRLALSAAAPRVTRAC